MIDSPLARAVRYVDDGWPAYNAAESFGVTVAQIEAVLRTRAAAPEGDAHATDAGGESGEELSSPEDRFVRLTPASSIKPRPVRWAWQDRLPIGEMALTPGRGGVGKSTFHAWLVARLTRGQLAGEHHGTPRACAIATTEDSWAQTVVPRLIAAGADLDLVYRVDVVTAGADVTLSLPRDLAGLGARLRDVDAALLSVDPLMSVVSATLDTHKDRDVRQALEPLKRLADSTGIVVLGNAHFNKSAGSDPVSLVTGSAAFVNVVRAVLAFVAEENDEDGPASYVISQVKNNLGRMDLPSLRYRLEPASIDTPDGAAEVGRLVMLGESDRSVEDILRDRGIEAEDPVEAAGWLKTYLFDNGGEASAPDVFKVGALNGFSKDQLKRAKKKLKVRSEKQDFDAGWMWRIGPEGGAKRVKGAGPRTPTPLHPFAPPSACECGRPPHPGTFPDCPRRTLEETP